MLGGLRYNRYDLMEMKCGYSYFRVIFQRIHKFPEFINRKEIFMNKAHCFLRVALTFALALSVSVAITFDVGSRNERAGRTGFAHLFEHMMFTGSENVGRNEYSLWIDTNGGENNATTSEDRTLYFATVPSNQLDMILFLESDRVRALDVSQESLDVQRKAVQEERRLRVDNEAYGKTDEKFQEVMFDNFAYKHSVIGP